MIHRSWQMHHYPGTLFYLTALLLGLLVSVPAILAGTVIQVDAIAIGTVDLHPAGDTITIAAENGPAAPLSVRSLVTGGSSGLITVTSVVAEHLDIIYPLSATLSDGSNTITISNIPIHSQYNTLGVDLPGGNIPVDISVGGKIVLPGNTIHGSYSGSMTIQLNFY